MKRTFGVARLVAWLVMAWLLPACERAPQQDGAAPDASVPRPTGVAPPSSTAAAPTDAAAPADAAAPIDAAAPTDAAGPMAAGDAGPGSAPRSCGDLSRDEKAALQRCAMSRISFSLGIRGALTARVEMSGRGLPRIRTENDIENKFRPAIAGDACDQAKTTLSAHLPCTWDVHGPYPVWTITVVPEPI